MALLLQCRPCIERLTLTLVLCRDLQIFVNILVFEKKKTSDVLT